MSTFESTRFFEDEPEPETVFNDGFRTCRFTLWLDASASMAHSSDMAMANDVTKLLRELADNSKNAED